MSDSKIAILYILAVLSGYLLAGLSMRIFHNVVGKKYREDHFVISRYFFLVFFPLAATILTVYYEGLDLAKVFVFFAILGPAFEWLFGFSYHKMIGQRLWTYHRLGLNGYTSFLTMPFWGSAGILFWLIAHDLAK